MIDYVLNSQQVPLMTNQIVMKLSFETKRVRINTTIL